ncbi:MAG: DUF4105 domain-containing protein [Deltaproteobacteria bacterium]|nr:DUF4105 domain-containing protein [Deltaproteobacteria bacterium]
MLDLRGASRVALVVVVLGGLVGGSRAVAQEQSPTATSSPRVGPRRYYVELITMGPGDLLFARFAHNAIRVRDRERRTDRVFNWGTFAFGPDFAWKFVKGHAMYWLSTQAFQDTLEIYASHDRYVIGQVLDLTDAEAEDLVARIERNLRPEHRQYRYHHFDDNCSTRVRDLLDTVTHGALRRSVPGMTDRSFRQTAYQTLGTELWLVGFLDIFANQRFDRVMSRWDELFLPERLHDAAKRVRVPRGNGGSRPLVILERRYVERQAPPPRREPPPVRPTWVLFGALAVMLALAMAVSARAPRAARWLGNTGFVLFGLVAGISGIASLVLWAFTDHADLAWNVNLLSLWPTDIALVVLGPRALGARRRHAALLFRYLAVHAVVTFGTVVVALAGLVRQDVGPVAVPVLGLVGAAALLAWGRTRGAEPVSAAAR